MANPLIIWPDGTMPLAPGNPTAAADNRAASRLSGYIAGSSSLDAATAATSMRSVDRSREQLHLRWRGPAAGVGTPYVAIFTAGGETNINAEYFDYSSSSGFSPIAGFPRSTMAVGQAFSLPRAAATDLYLAKSGNGNIVEVILSANPISLYRPPQENAVGNVSKKWNTFPKISVRGDFLGSSSRPATGRLKIDMEDLRLDWIEGIWEPFREYAAQGGVFAYAVDIEGRPFDVVYCFAATDIPPPEIKAGGYGSVSLTAGVAAI